MKSLRLAQLAAVALAIAGLITGIRAATGQRTEAVVTVGGVAVGISIDLLSAILIAFAGSIILIVASYAIRNLAGQRATQRFGLLLAGAAASLGLMATGASLPVIAAGWTLSGLALAALIDHAGSAESHRAARHVRRTLLVGDALLWTGVIAAIALLPSVNRSELAEAAGDAQAVTIITLLIAGAAIVRSALAPVQRWLPETAEAPSPVSAFLHAGIVNGAGVIGALAWPLFAAAPITLAVLIATGLASIAIGTWTAQTRRDVKGRLACSTTAQMGYMTLQLGIGLPAAAVLHLVGHGFYKAWLFLRAGGAVSRARIAPPAPRLATALPLAIAAAAVAVAAVIAAPAAGSLVSSFGSTALIPLLAAAGAVAVAAAGAATTRRASAVAGAVTLIAIAGGAYAWLLLGWDVALTPELPAVPAWTGTAAVAIIAVTLAVAILIVIGSRALTRRPTGGFARLIARISLAPWTTTGAAVATGGAPVALAADQVDGIVAEAARVIAPAWPLRNVVAANPIAGLEDLPYHAAAAEARTALGAETYLPLSRYLELYDAGRITASDVARALADADRPADAHAIDVLVARGRAASRLDRQPREAVRTLVSEDALEQAALWCRAAWSRAADDGDPWALWRAADGGDLPADPRYALARILSETAPDHAGRTAHVRRLLTAAPGWAAHAAWRARRLESPVPLLQLVALRAALAARRPVSTADPMAEPAPVNDDLAIWQAAYEAGFRGPLVEAVADRAAALAAGDGEPREAAPDAQLVFCIDVRSERIRRAFEDTGDYATLGFAGFFGAFLEYTGAAGGSFEQCPVLFRPTTRIADAPASATVRDALRCAAAATSSSPITPLPMAEGCGIAAGAAAAMQTGAPRLWARVAGGWGAFERRWGARGNAALPAAVQATLDLDARAAMAGGALRAMGLTTGFAPILVICGHAAMVENNAFAAAYDCGACGGNGGHVNARVLAAAINDPAVRRLLAADGLEIPADTIAVAAAHDTTTDAIELDPRFVWPATHTARVAQLALDLGRAQAASARERAASLPGADATGDDAAIVRQVTRRGRDWAQPFPEWGLAGNAAFVVGPRALTRQLDLGGRVFLHSYDPATDPDRSTLELILTAPTVVTQWINAQYGLSTIDPRRFGSGDKATHNVVGDIGVQTGAHGDLRIGLPWQALFAQDPAIAPASGLHEPLRLLVVVWADPGDIHDVLDRHPHVRQLVDNEWIALVALDPSNGAALRWAPGTGWRHWHAADTATAPVA